MAGAAPGPSVIADPWTALRRLTTARIALGRAGVSLPTRAHLEFQLAHARARDAVHEALAVAPLAAAVEALGLTTLALRSAAPDRTLYLQRPDLGRTLDPASRTLLERRAAARPDTPRRRRPSADLAIVIADGLSALAVARNAAPLISAVLPHATREGWTLAPVAIVEQGRVAIGDEIGALIGARAAVVLIGERPGLSSPDSLGVYLTFDPKPGRTDAERNCISNIRKGGLAPASAARTLAYLVREALARKFTGVELKDESAPPPSAIRKAPRNFLLE
ncbi:MAG TPA: ethanolamine ammonia-lyase subunit EutC [Hyphomicrobiaceae bacterium]|nr:ethanolamine ammonia-lyase subunit EutC [Hyphomicrobiaceae bacterium]